MDARTGKRIRLRRLLEGGSARSIIVAASHAVLTGPPTGLRNVPEMRTSLGGLTGASGIMVPPGSVAKLEDIFLGRPEPSLVIHLDWKSFGRKVFTPGEDGRSEGRVGSLATIEEVAAAGADAVMTYLYIGQDDHELELREIERNARLAAECARLGIGLIIEPRAALDYKDTRLVTDGKLLAFYCRVAAEIGADIVKCIWPGSREQYEGVTSTATVPVVLAGGPGGEDPHSTFTLAADAVAAGGSGVMFGRRIYTAAHPGAVLAGLRGVVFDDMSPDEAMSLYESRTA
jgi:fructose-bisphosphate aldolase, class I